MDHHPDRDCRAPPAAGGDVNDTPSEALRRPIVQAMIQSRGMEEGARARFVMDRFSAEIMEGGWLLMHRDVIEKLNAAMLGAQAVIQMQEAELRRLAEGGAEVGEGFCGEVETVQ
jgi:hypothetical protein